MVFILYFIYICHCYIQPSLYGITKPFLKYQHRSKQRIIVFYDDYNSVQEFERCFTFTDTLMHDVNYFHERDKNNTSLYTTLTPEVDSFNLILTPEVFKLIFSEVNYDSGHLWRHKFSDILVYITNVAKRSPRKNTTSIQRRDIVQTSYRHSDDEVQYFPNPFSMPQKNVMIYDEASLRKQLGLTAVNFLRQKISNKDLIIP